MIIAEHLKDSRMMKEDLVPDCDEFILFNLYSYNL
jgi:hypothetical protein